MFKKGWYVKELKVVQEEVKDWPKWKLGQPEEDTEKTQATNLKNSFQPAKKLKLR